MAENNELEQREVVQLRTDDLICVVQGGREKRWMVQNFLNLVRAMIGTPPKVYFNSAQVTAPCSWRGNANTSSGTATFNLTDENGDALFTQVQQVSITISDNLNVYACSYALSGDLKTLTVIANRLTIAALALVFVSAANGTTVRVNVLGQ